MRWVGQGLVVLILVGCSRDNPWFVVNSAGAVESEGSSAGTSSVGSSAEASSAASSTGDSGHDDTLISSTSTSTTGPGNPVDTLSTTIDPDSSSSGDSSESTASSTGEPTETPPYDFYDNCPGATWTAKEPLVEFPCGEKPGVAPSIVRSEQLLDDQLAKVIGVYPEQVEGAFLDGLYEVKLGGKINPRFKTGLYFPPGGELTDEITISFYIEIPNAVDVYSDPIVLIPGDKDFIDLPLGPMAVQVPSVNVHLQVLIGPNTSKQSVALWVNPRIVEVP